MIFLAICLYKIKNKNSCKKLGREEILEKREVYETPTIEVIEFEFTDAIAASGDLTGNDVFGSEQWF